ncbi:MAG: hypothetical protein RIR34_585 [Actinomycetota bacterium]
MTSETTVVDSGEIYRVLSNLGLAQDFAEAAASALMDDPIGALMCGAELAIIIGRIRRIYESVLATSSNYKNVEFGLPAKFESETSGTAPALAMALADALTYLPNVGQGVSAAIAGGTFSESQATSLSQLVNRLRDLQAARPGTLRIEQIGGAGGVGSVGAGGARQFVVYLPGMTSEPHISSRQPFNLTSGIYALAGVGASDAELATNAAMRLAGIGTKQGDKVTFVGYSEGAIVAANIAKSGKYKVSGLVSIGGQIGNVDIPKGVSVLSIENTNDLLAKLDFKQNPNNKNWLSVELDGSSPLQAHDIKVYAEQAKHIDAGGYAAIQRKLQEILPGSLGVDGQTANTLYKTQLIG